VLQKLIEDRKLLEKGSCLCNYSKDLVHEFNSFFDGPFLHTLNLSFVHNVHNFVFLQRSPCRVKRAKSHSRFD